MKCDNCDNEATVHEVTVRKGKKVEKHLCEQCAKKDGIAVQSHAPINALLSKFVMSSSGQSEEEEGGVASCPMCETTFSEFRQHGLLGCPNCYEAFEDQLGPLIERAQEGATHHIGKTPARSSGAVDRQRVIASLRKQLTEALQTEHYERAAELRDELKRIGNDCDEREQGAETEKQSRGEA